MKKTVTPKEKASLPTPQADPAQDLNNLPADNIVNNDGTIPVDQDPFTEPLVNDIIENNPGNGLQDQPNSVPDSDIPSMKEMMDLIKKQGEEISLLRTTVGKTLEPTPEPGEHTTWSYRYAIYPVEKYGDGVITSWRTKKGANVVGKETNSITISVKFWDSEGMQFIEKEYDLPIMDFSKVILRSNPVEAKALYNEIRDARGNVIPGKGDQVAKIRQIDPVSGKYILKMQPTYQHYNVVLPIKEFGGQNYMFNTRYLNA